VTDNDILCHRIDFYHSEVHCLSYERIEVTYRFDIDLRTRKKCLDSGKRNRHTALDTVDYLSVDNGVVLDGIIDFVPDPQNVRFSLGENKLSHFVFDVFEVYFYLVTDLQLFFVLELKLRNDTLGFKPDINGNVLVRNSDDSTFNNFLFGNLVKRARIELLHLVKLRRVVVCEKLHMVVFRPFLNYLLWFDCLRF